MAALTVRVVGMAGGGLTVTVEFPLEAWYRLVPAKLTVTGTDPGACATSAMEQLTEPFTSVVPLQLWAEPPEPSVRSSVMPGSGVPNAVRVPASVADWPSVADVVPV